LDRVVIHEARCLAELAVIAEDDRLVLEPQLVSRVLIDLDLLVREPEQRAQDVSDPRRDARARVVDLALLALLEREPRGLDRVADVLDVAGSVKIAHVDDWIGNTRINLCNLHGEVGARVLDLADAGLVEISQPDRVDTEVEEVLASEQILPDLADAIGMQGLERERFLNGHVLLAERAVLGAAAGNHDAGRKAQFLHGLEHVDRAVDVGLESLVRVLPRRLDVALRGHVENTVWLELLDEIEHPLAVPDVDKIEIEPRITRLAILEEVRDVFDAVARFQSAVYIVPPREAKIGEVGPDEAADTGDDEAHDYN